MLRRKKRARFFGQVPRFALFQISGSKRVYQKCPDGVWEILPQEDGSTVRVGQPIQVEDTTLVSGVSAQKSVLRHTDD